MYNTLICIITDNKIKYTLWSKRKDFFLIRIWKSKDILQINKNNNEKRIAYGNEIGVQQHEYRPKEIFEDIDEEEQEEYIQKKK